MEIKIKGTEIKGGMVAAPPSKSYTHRGFVVASLAEGESAIRGYLRASDTLSTIEGCRAFGAGIEEGEGRALVRGTGGAVRAPAKTVDVGNSGTTLRLLSGVAALCGRATLTGDESVRSRPNGPLLEALEKLGCIVRSGEGGRAPITVEGGRIRGGGLELRGDISSQFLSSLLIIGPYTEEGLEIRLTTGLISRPYVDMTLGVMEDFGIDVRDLDQEGFRVPPGIYRGRDYGVEGDYSSASYFFALAAMTGTGIAVSNLNPDSRQGDARMLEIVEGMGAAVAIGKDAIEVRGQELEGTEVDLSDAPDLLPPVAAVAAKAKGTTRITNVAHARFKESDRIAACATELRKLGAEIEEKKNGLVIRGTERLKGAEVRSYQDHRVAMALAVAGAAAEGTTRIEDGECVDISYPGFYGALKNLGVEV